MRVDWKPGTLIYPLPAILVSSGSTPEDYNLFTASWVGTICSNPPMCYVSIRPERHSYGLIKQNMEFGLNLTTVDMARETDWCGVTSGRQFNKFEECKLTPETGKFIQAPLVAESPISLECRVREIVPLGSHDMFVAEVVNTRANDLFINPETGAFDMKKANLLAYSHGEYYGLGDFLGYFGWSVKKGNKPIRRRK